VMTFFDPTKRIENAQFGEKTCKRPNWAMAEMVHVGSAPVACMTVTRVRPFNGQTPKGSVAAGSRVSANSCARGELRQLQATPRGSKKGQWLHDCSQGDSASADYAESMRGVKKALSRSRKFFGNSQLFVQRVTLIGKPPKGSPAKVQIEVVQTLATIKKLGGKECETPIRESNPRLWADGRREGV